MSRRLTGWCGCAILALVLTGVALTGCNTVEGAGKDIEAGGEAISDGARDVKESITD